MSTNPTSTASPVNREDPIDSASNIKQDSWLDFWWRRHFLWASLVVFLTAVLFLLALGAAFFFPPYVKKLEADQQNEHLVRLLILAILLPAAVIPFTWASSWRTWMLNHRAKADPPTIEAEHSNSSKARSNRASRWWWLLTADMVLIAFLIACLFRDVPHLGLDGRWLWVFAILGPLGFIPVGELLKRPRDYEERAAELEDRIVELGKIQLRTKFNIGDGKFNSPDAEDPRRARYLLACVDKFVDEAQDFLTARARVYYVLGTSTLLASFAILHLAAHVAYQKLTERDYAWLKDFSEEKAVYVLILSIFMAVAFAAAIFAIIKALFTYSKSFFHEATRLLDRRHALRFGRLYIYLIDKAFDFKDLEESFQWNKESATIFQEISPQKITENIVTQLLEALAKRADEKKPEEIGAAVASAMAARKATN